jgi:hypothetical protein
MKRLLALSLVVAAAVVSAGCHDNNDHATSPTGGSLAQVELGAPSAPVVSGNSFNVDVKARDGGFSVLHSTHVRLVLPPPLVVDSADVTAGGGSVTFTNGVSGATVDYNFGSIGKFEQETGTIHTHGDLLPSQNNVRVTVTAELTSDEIHPGDASAHVDVILQH